MTFDAPRASATGSEPTATTRAAWAPDAPAFEAPWQAEAYALAQLLVETGALPAAAWSDTLAARLTARLEAGAADTPETYFAAVLDALQACLAGHGLVSAEDMARRTAEWRAAYAHTPHGAPVTLARG